MSCRIAGTWLLLLAISGNSASLQSSAWSQDHDKHVHGGDAEANNEKAPTIFLDKSPRVVAYQLNRLDNQKLLLVERSTDDPKYAPIFEAILNRAGMSPQYREDALKALVAIRQSDVTTELFSSLDSLKMDQKQDADTARQLARMLLSQDSEQLRANASKFEQATQSKNQLVRSVGFAGLFSAKEEATAFRLGTGPQGSLDWLAAVPLVPEAESRDRLRGKVLEQLDSSSVEIRNAAVSVLASIRVEQSDTFRRLAQWIDQPELRESVVRTLMVIDRQNRDPEMGATIVGNLVRFAEETPAEGRTTESFTDAMQLVDQLLADLPVDKARAFRQRLREVTVRVISIGTVMEEMRFDTPYFVVEAGRPVQVLLKNVDLMPHNLVITTPGDLQLVAEQGQIAGPDGGYEGKQYVPAIDQVLFATNMVPSGQSERLTFTAPIKPGEYPYVCTFPRHWMRMYGVMVVVEDLDAWLQDPVPPQDPLGSNRAFVQSWTASDFESDFDHISENGSIDLGQKIFSEATCVQCHKANGIGGAVGPELNGLAERWKGDHAAILREILEPSHRIDPKFAVHLVVTTDGLTISGIVIAEDKKTVSLLDNPESKEATTIARDNIEEIVKTSTSMMPKGLLDRFSKMEVISLLQFLESLQSPDHSQH